MGGLTDVIESSGLLKIVKTAAPLLGAVLGSPAASLGINLLGNIFGTDSKDVSGILNAIQSDPEAILKIKTLESNHAIALAQVASKNYDIEASDRQSARNREISLQDHVPTILAVGFLVNYAIVQLYCVTHPSSEIDIISARFQDVLIMIMSYYFGSSYKNKSVLK
ncbi:hypothetical protein KW791_00195 [Candidatus Parcubacteria bacterium]|nr:hypothetical protein [Candidatus Parcubacteria bacterium]